MARPRTRREDDKGFHIRIPSETWKFLKMTSMLKGMTMSEIVIESVEKQRKNITKKYPEIGNFDGKLNKKYEE